MIRRFHSAAKPQPKRLSNLMIPVTRLGVSLRDRRATQGRAARPGPPGHAAARPKNIAAGLLLLRSVAPHNAMGPRRVSAVRDGPPYLTRFGSQHGATRPPYLGRGDEDEDPGD